MTKYIFVTGGVVSSLGKGIAVASIGRMLKSRGLGVAVIKLDPYLNVDPGTMSPFQHGEVFVTVDGAETDLDLGHYERFIDIETTQLSNLTAGQVYTDVITREREGKFLGGTIQTVPHVTNMIKQHVIKLGETTGADVVVVEVGGTVGDIEGQPFLEAIRQLRSDVGRDNTFYIHLTLLPYLGTTKELKTKPTQHSVQTLRGAGILPDAILCRSDLVVTRDISEKISLYCDVPVEAVVGLETLDTVYEVPMVLESHGLGDYMTAALHLETEPCDLKSWTEMARKITTPKPSVKIAVVGKYVDLEDSYISVAEALRHAGIFHERDIEIDWIQSEDIETDGPHAHLGEATGIVIPGGFGPRGIEGMIQAAEYARIRAIPYLGLCLGMQVMVIEYARSGLGLSTANSTEFDEGTLDPVIAYLPGQQDLVETGGTMRLGIYPCQLRSGTKAAAAYHGVEVVQERHRHRYEVNNDYRDRLEDAGLIGSGMAPDGSLVEVTEVAGHPFMIGSQYHPEFGSRPDRPHPLFRDFIANARETIREGGQPQLPL